MRILISQLNRSSSILAGVSILGCLATTALVGCGSEPEESVAAPPAYTPSAPVEEVATVTPIRELKERLRIDERVDLPEDLAPDTDEARIAVLEFFDAFARGDADALRPILSPLDRRELDAMVDSGQWRKTTESITTIFVQTGSAMGSVDLDLSDLDLGELIRASKDELQRQIESGEFRQMAMDIGLIPESQIEEIERMAGTAEFDDLITQIEQSLAATASTVASEVFSGEECALAYFEVAGGDFANDQVQLWYFSPQSGDRFGFQAAPTPPNMVHRLSGSDWIAAWHDVIAYEIALANQPDERVAPPRRHLEDDEETTTSGGGSGSPGSRPLPGGPPPPPMEAPTGPRFGR